MNQPRPEPAAAEARRRQIEALKEKAEQEKLEALAQQVAGVGAAGAVVGRGGLVLLGAWLMTRGESLIGSFGAACLLIDAVLCAVLFATLCRAALRSILLRFLLAATFVVGALVALPAALAGVVGPIGPFRPVSATLLMALGMTLFLAAYGLGAVYFAWLFGVGSEESLRKLERNTAET